MADDDKPTTEDLTKKIRQVKRKKEAVDAEIAAKKVEVEAETDAKKKEELESEVHALQEVAEGFALILKGVVSILEGVGKMIDAAGRIGRSIPQHGPRPRRLRPRSHDHETSVASPGGRGSRAARDG